MKHTFPALLALAACSCAFAAEPLPIVNVTADFRDVPDTEFASSITVIGGAEVIARDARHLEELLNLAPNVNFAAGASRGRFYQVRGIGERSQFVDPINPSVGLMIDGVNFSGLGNAGTLLDVQQVEVLRGPQGTRFGANALAGMINIRSNEPTEEFEGSVSAGVGNYDSYVASAVLSGPLAQDLLGRLAVQQYRSDGFIENDYLDRDDTNDRDELTLRGKLLWQASDRLTLDTTLTLIDVDNGYDAFSLDNNRHTLSDQPGVDTQQTHALALHADWNANARFRVDATLAVEQTEVEYGYDEDWTNTEICEGLACDSDDWGFDWWYSSTDTYFRERDSLQFDLRLISTEDGKLFGQLEWVTGLYAIDQREDLRREFFDWDLGSPTTFASQYDSTRIAWYGELAAPVSERLTLSTGIRVEDFSSDYDDLRGVSASPDETLWGGEISLEFQADDNTMIYGLVSRGFKTGGVNGDALGKAEQNNFDPAVIGFLNSRLVFDTEVAHNFEVGLKGDYLQDRLQLRLAAFHMERDHVQLKGWYNEGPLFVGYTDNGAAGTNRGLELQAGFQPIDTVNLFAAIGWLDTEIEDFFILDGDTLINQTGRDQAHAPHYQFNIGADLQLNSALAARIELDGRDSFYYSDSHDQQSKSYALLHASITYTLGDLVLRLWGRNLTDKDYTVRGFYFANDPREFYEDDQAYTQLGDPRTCGLTATYNF
ncbi:MAG: TonB-dependent receptor [Gammaproteobacteria bacterium]|nr:TonB-dependent receptor [Gammaproteobacteria bacterium]